MTDERLYVEKKIFCPKCGHVHEFSLTVSVSVVNFVIDGRCVSCGSAIIIDKNTLFRNAQSTLGTPIEKIDDLESISTDINTSNTDSQIQTIDEQLMPEEKKQDNSEIIPANFFD